MAMRCSLIFRYSLYFAMMNLLILPGTAKSQTPRFDHGILSRRSVERILFHPGMLRSLTGLHIEVFYTRPFGIRDLETRSMLLSAPWKNQTFGFTFTSFGGAVYTENKLTLTHVIQIAHSLYLTSELSWLPVKITGFEGTSDKSVSEGLYFENGSYLANIRMINIYSSGSANTREGRNKAIQMAAGFHPVRRLSTLVYFLSEKELPASWVFENRIALHETVTVAAEIGDNPGYYAFGFTIFHTGFQFAYTWKSHRDLGSTSQIGLSYELSGYK